MQFLNDAVSRAMMPFAFDGTVPVPGLAEQNALLPCTETPLEVQFQYATTFPTSPPVLLQSKVNESVACPNAEGVIDNAGMDRKLMPYMGTFWLHNRIPFPSARS